MLKVKNQHFPCFCFLSVFDRVQENSFRNIRPSTGKQPMQLTKCKGAKRHFWELPEQVWAQIWCHWLLLVIPGCRAQSRRQHTKNLAKSSFSRNITKTSLKQACVVLENAASQTQSISFINPAELN